jgi:hypothetical protein
LGEALSRAACATVEATAVGASHGFFFRGKSRNR